MRLSGPLLTLTAAGGLAAVLVVSNVVAGTAASSPAAAPQQVTPQQAAPDAAPASAPDEAPGEASDEAESGTGPDPVDDAAEPAGEPAAEPPAEPAEPADDGGAAEAAELVTWTYAGEVHGTELTTALRVTGDEVVAYVCDGADYEIWLRGTTVDGVLELSGEADSRMSGAHTPELAAGVLWLGDSQWTFSTASAEWPDWAPPVPNDAPTQE